MPGLGKTLLARTLAQVFAVEHNRIQFTPDLMPADITGTNLYPGGRDDFEFRPGPIFANLVLADEIQPGHAQDPERFAGKHAGGCGYRLRPDPGAAQALLRHRHSEPLEMEGTYPLPEAQLDRFLFKILVPYPSVAELRQIVLRTTGVSETAPARHVGEEILAVNRLARRCRWRTKSWTTPSISWPPPIPTACWPRARSGATVQVGGQSPGHPEHYPRRPGGGPVGRAL